MFIVISSRYCLNNSASSPIECMRIPYDRKDNINQYYIPEHKAFTIHSVAVKESAFLWEIGIEYIFIPYQSIDKFSYFSPLMIYKLYRVLYYKFWRSHLCLFFVLVEVYPLGKVHVQWLLWLVETEKPSPLDWTTLCIAGFQVSLKKSGHSLLTNS